MEKNKKTLKINLKSSIIMFMLMIMIIFLGITLGVRYGLNSAIKKEYPLSQTVSIEKYNNKNYYIIKDDYSGKYDLQYISLSEYRGEDGSLEETFEKSVVMDYEEYKTYCKEWGLKRAYHDSSKKYIVFSYAAFSHPNVKVRLADVEYFENTAKLYIWDTATGVTSDISAYVIVVPTDKEIDNISCQPLYTAKEFENVKEYGSRQIPAEMSIDKPIIYIYPEKETNVLVKLGNPEKITCSYPKYKDEGWNVIAKLDGNLIDCASQRNLYSLYYESLAVKDIKLKNEGFIVKGKDSAKFLEEKLEILGLTEREAEEFIIYWLPKLEANNYNYIRFATTKEIDENMPLEINPKPDTIIRVLMTFKGLEEKIDVKEQKLEQAKREGFTVVEWGGTEIK